MNTCIAFVCFPSPFILLGESVFLVDDILNMKIQRGKRMFLLIKWKGYVDPTWIPI